MKRTAFIFLCILTIVSLNACAQAQIDWVMTHETEHFSIFTTDGDVRSVLPLSETLEANYERIIADFQMTTAPRFSIYLYPDIDTYHRAIGNPNASPSSVGTIQGTDVWMVSPLYSGGALDTQSMLTVGVHEFTHAVINHVNGSYTQNNYQIPIWLSEGLAGYESGQMTPEWRERMAKLIAEGKIPSITELTPDQWEQVKGLPFSITLVEYLVNRYGFEKLVEIIKSPSNPELILGVTFPELDSAWHEYLLENYR